MAVTPNTNIRLLKCNLNLDEFNQLNFASKNAQYNYFNSLQKLDISGATYQRHNNVIRYAAHIDTILEYNYVMYQNNNYSDKWFYAYITRMEYVNDNMTNIYIKTDPYQTWQFDLTFMRSFVEREHVNNDTVGLHTVPENVELGEYITNSVVKDEVLELYSYMVQVSEWTVTDETHPKPLSTNLGGVPAVGGFYVCDSISVLDNIVAAYQNGRESAILNVYVAPRWIIDHTSQTLQYEGKVAPTTYTKSIAKQTTLNGYTPVNKKLLTFPYNFIELSNNNGTANVLQYELFSGNQCTFTVAGVPTCGCSIKCSPTNYKGHTTNEEEGIFCGKFPTCGWVRDTYTNWLSQNAVNIGLGVTSSAITILGGAALMATGGGGLAGASAIVSGGMGIANAIGQMYEHDIIPNSANGNINGGDLNSGASTNTFYFYKKSIKQEYAQIIDGYFSAYGYKVNTYKVPNINGRANWNYVKTINANIEAYIPQEDLDEIKRMFDNGVTIWHNPSTFLDYSQNNGII